MSGRWPTVSDEKDARKPVRITWRADGDECEAQVGERMRWRNRRRGGPWTTGRTVVAVERDPERGVWFVLLAPGELPTRGDDWAPALICGRDENVEVEFRHSTKDEGDPTDD
jgi:hypothetical protein